MLQAILFLSLLAATAASCNRTCGKSTVQFPFGFSPSCHIQLSCNSNSGISFSDFPVQNFMINNYTFSVNISANCARPVSTASSFFSTNYALTHKNGLFLRNCTPSSSIPPCLLPTLVVSQMSHQVQAGCTKKEDNLTCIFNNTGNDYLTKDYVVKESSCANFFTSILYEPYVAGQAVLVLGLVEIGWWMTGGCRCAANGSCSRLGSEVEDGYWCKCNDGFIGDGFADGDGCREICAADCERNLARKLARSIVGGIASGTTVLVCLILFCLVCRRYLKRTSSSANYHN